ncbi:MAG TPA: ATP phosphoribosyltransferase [Rectinemataceae bacterium]|nr:ATP phosphoribosyltransferase [Rectinemataceae bacterium]
MQEVNVSLRLGLPKGRMEESVYRLLGDAGLPVRGDERGYRPSVGSRADGAGIAFETKVLKPQNIVEMLAAGSRDLGFAGADWVRELGAGLVELLDTGLDPVRVVAAAPNGLLVDGRLPRGAAGGRRLVVASEYENIARSWIADNAPTAQFVRSYGATEVFPPEDADVIVDNTASGATLRANGLAVVDEILASSTRLYASREAWADERKRPAMETVVLLLRAVLEARRRVMLEINVPAEKLEGLTAYLPCLRAPTVSTLQGGSAFAVKVAAPRADLAVLIPEIKRLGGEDIVVTELAQLVP